MMLDINYVIGVISILGSLISAYFSYEIYKYNRLSKAWLSVSTAFVIMVFLRIVTFTLEFDLFPQLLNFLRLIGDILFLVISGLYIWGFWSMKKNFENFEIVEKKTREKAISFHKSRKKK